MPYRGFRRVLRPAFTLLGLIGAQGFAGAADPPDAAINPATGAIEITDATSDADGEPRVRYVAQKSSSGRLETAILAEGTKGGLDPKIEITTEGQTWVVWWREAEPPEVLCTVKDAASGTWSDVRRVSDPGESARYPQIVHDGKTIWVVYESPTPDGASIVVKGTQDDPQPFPTGIVLGATTFSGNRAPRIHAEAGHLWVTWVDSSSHLACSEYDPTGGVWSLPEYESYAGSSVDLARAAMRARVLSE